MNDLNPVMYESNQEQGSTQTGVGGAWKVIVYPMQTDIQDIVKLSNDPS